MDTLTRLSVPVKAPHIEPVNPRDSWPAWTDADRWNLAAAPPSGLDLTEFVRRFEPTPEEQEQAARMFAECDRD